MRAVDVKPDQSTVDSHLGVDVKADSSLNTVLDSHLWVDVKTDQSTVGSHLWLGVKMDRSTRVLDSQWNIKAL